MATDASGAVIPGVAVEVRNNLTGVSQTSETDSTGFYNFPALSIGHYTVVFRKDGFKAFQVTDVIIQVNSLLRIDAVLQVGAVTQDVVVTAAAAVEVNTRNAQMGEVIEEEKTVSLPLNGRSYTDLLALQPGVVPVSSAEYNATAPDGGSLDAGSFSVSGGRENFNGYMINGASVEEQVFDAPGVVPNLDSIAEFRILTSNTDAEYGNYAGGLVNVATKSGTNEFHGDAFDFLRNTDFDARNYFDSSRGVFRQNQFGGTVGGPIRRDKMFFFGDYQGTRQTIGESTGRIPVPSADDRAGNLADIADSLTGTVNGQFWADTLSARLGYTVANGTPYYTAGCASTTDCVFPNAVVPSKAWAPTASPLLSYIPTSNVSGGYFTTSAYPQTLNDNKGAVRVDAKSRWGMLSAYYLDDQYTTTLPYPGGNLPGFKGTSTGIARLLVLGDTTTFGSSAVNQFTLSAMRDGNSTGTPIGGIGPSLSSLGFDTPGDQGIAPANPSLEGLPDVILNNYAFGPSPFPLKQQDNTFQVQDGFSKVIRSHSLKFGADYHYDQVNVRSTFAFSNGAFFLFGTETGSDFADFLLGAPSSYNQGSAANLDLRNWYNGLYAQDSWRATPNLTVNYGVRWDIIPFFADTKDRNPAYRVGVQSVAFPTAPLGYDFPGENGIPSRFTNTKYSNVAPRIGLAYAPQASDGIWHKLLGGSGESSIRAGFGMYYTAIEGQSTAVTLAAPPYGLFYVSSAPPLMDRPFIVRGTGQNMGQRFPVPVPPTNVSGKNPDSNIDWSEYEPISSDSSVAPNATSPYIESFNLSVQRQLGANTLLSVSYVGTRGRHLVDDLDNNPGVPSTCLAVSQQSQVAPGTPTCGPFGENGIYQPVSGATVNGTRAPFGPLFGGNGYYETIGTSAYNALQAEFHHRGKRLDLLAGYTYSKSMDNSSGYGDQVYPPNPKLSEALSAFDMKHDFVSSYTYELPFDELFRADNRLTRGWKISGITRFATGLPVTLTENDDNSLLGDCNTGPNGNCTDLPNFTPGKILADTNPRHGNAYFNTSLFTTEDIGQQGNARRRFFHGPGINNWDLAMAKDLRITEKTNLEIRGEFFNAFNHAQFYGAGAVNGNVLAGDSFGTITNAAAPRIGQVAMKFVF